MTKRILNQFYIICLLASIVPILYGKKPLNLPSPGYFTVAIMPSDDSNVKLCSGALISEDLIITSSECIGNEENVLVTVGAVDLNDFDDPDRIDFQISRDNFIYLNLPNSRDSPIIIRTPKPIPLSDVIQKIGLPDNPNESFARSDCAVHGWGDLDETLELSDELVSVTSKGKCFSNYKEIFDDTFLCTEGKIEDYVCVGEQGSPLVCEENGKCVLVGLLSIGPPIGCETKGPALYKRMTQSIKDMINAIQ